MTGRAETPLDHDAAVGQPVSPFRASAQKRVVIIGGGFAGLAAARALRDVDADVVLIDQRNHHIFQPLLYQVATAVLSPADIANPLRQLEVRQRNLDVILAKVTKIDRTGRTIEAAVSGGNSLTISFDYLVVAAGARASYFGHDEFERWAPGLKNLGDAEAIRAKILRAFELAETSADDAERARQMTFVLVGAGPTGVELASSLAHMVNVTLRHNFRRVDPAKAKIILLDAANRVLPTFGESVSRSATQRLQKLGVKVMTGVRVERVDEQGVIAGAERIESATVLWTAGIAASPLAKMVTDKVDRAGRALVDACLRVVDVKDVFVIGDCASVLQNGRPAPGVAQVAIQQGRYVGRAIADSLAGRNLSREFHYFDKGNMAVIGRNYAVLERGTLHAAGFLVWVVWALVHILSLPQLQTRLRVQRQWLWSYFTGERADRLIPEALERDESFRIGNTKV